MPLPFLFMEVVATAIPSSTRIPISDQINLIIPVKVRSTIDQRSRLLTVLANLRNCSSVKIVDYHLCL